MSQMRRREALGLAAVLAVFSSRKAVAAVIGPGQSEPVSLVALPAWLDTLIPADETPSATQLGINADSFAREPQGSSMLRPLQLGCAWLDAEARKLGAAEFSALDPAGRERVAGTAAASPSRTVQRAFFELTQRVAFAQYYARPESWPGLGYSGPPQPAGYPDHAERPA
jgi:hypothetical protein